MSTPVKLGHPLSLGQPGGLPYFQVTAFIKSKNTVTIKYGVLNVNSRFVVPKDKDGNSVKIGDDSILTGVQFGDFIYLKINGILKKDTTATIEFLRSATRPEDMKVPAKPFPSLICLAWIDSTTGKIFDLRPAWIISVFSFLG